MAPLGEHGAERGIAALLSELAPENPNELGRAGAAIALARAGRTDDLRAQLEREPAGRVRDVMTAALQGRTDRNAYRVLDAR